MQGNLLSSRSGRKPGWSYKREAEKEKDGATGAPVYSLHEHGVSRPTPIMLTNLDALVYDLQEVGARFWTYTTTLGYMLEAAAAQKIPIYVLDRPNPINGIAVEDLVVFTADVSDMRSDHHIRQRAQRMRGRQWFGIKNVKRRSSDAVLG